MATMTVSNDGRNKVARSVVEFIRSLDVFAITELTLLFTGTGTHADLF